jgi:hypothetical protein
MKNKNMILEVMFVQNKSAIWKEKGAENLKRCRKLL